MVTLNKPLCTIIAGPRTIPLNCADNTHNSANTTRKNTNSCSDC
jgi:hypothetical protein